jgi:outer membrane protein assembly factor BamB
MLQRAMWWLPCWCLAAFAFPAAADDWPQWQGPERNAISQETSLLPIWPAGGPRLTWQVKGLGGGYSTPTIAAGHIFGLGFQGADEVAWALDESSGKEIWKVRIAAARPAAGGEAREGSRGSATVDGSVLYALGQSGDLVCLDTATGAKKWQKNLVRDFGGAIPRWGYSESPLVDGNKVICTPGGGAATLVALNKKTGAPIWRARVPQGNGAAYASVVVGEVGGQRQYVQLLHGGVVGIAADTGKFLWGYAKAANGVANCSTPIFHDSSVFAASGYGTGGGLVQLTRKGKLTAAKEVYFTKHMKNQHGGMVLVDGFLYGSDDPGSLVCLEFQTGKVMWEERRPGKGSIIYAEGRLYYRNEGGPIVLVEANPQGYVEKGRFDQPNRSGKAAWPHPIIANGKLYIRDQDLLLCYDVKARTSKRQRPRPIDQ